MKVIRAFTLIEVMVVLAIIAALSGLGITALIQFRNGVELNNGIFQLNSILQTAENNARNATSTGGTAGSTPDYYVLEFGATSIQTKSCNKQGTSGTTCTNNEVINEPAGVDWYTTTTTPCVGIAYEKRSGDLVFRQANGTIVTTGQCRISITITSNGSKTNQNLIRTYTFDASEDTYTVQ